MLPHHPRPTLFPYTTLFRSRVERDHAGHSTALGNEGDRRQARRTSSPAIQPPQSAVSYAAPGEVVKQGAASRAENRDRKSTRLNSSHRTISYAVFCLKKKIE